MDRIAFGVSAVPLVAFLLYAAVDLSSAELAVAQAAGFCADVFGGFWQVLALVSCATAFALAASKHGGRRLGGLSAPEMPTLQWIAVILCTLLAGGGVFWSAAEPLFHFQNLPPVFSSMEPETEEAVNAALAQSFLHWGFLAWSLVGSLGAVGLLVLQEQGPVPFRPRSLLRLALGSRAERSPVGPVVDGLSILAAAAGTIGPIGFLGLQLAYALEVMAGVESSSITQLAVIVALVGLATASAVSGIDRGIRWLSRLNVWLALLLGALVVVLGPGAFVLDHFFEAFGAYVERLPSLALHRSDKEWLRSWTVFYWGWFLGYGPLMSLFVARISRGRTLREIVLAVGVTAPVLTNLWFSVLGGSGLFYELREPGVVTNALQADGLPAALLVIVEQLPGALWLTPAFVVLVFLFLATSADSMAYTISMIISGQETPHPGLRAFYALAMGAVAAVLVLVGEGSIRALQSFIVVTAVPVSFLMASLVFSVPRLLHETRGDGSHTGRPKED